MPDNIVPINRRKKLSVAQEQFCVEVASGKTYVDAYIAAYPNAAKWQSDAAYNKGHLLAKRDEIRVRIDELKSNLAKEIEKKFIWTEEKSVMILSEIAMTGDKEASRIAAIRELNAMLGFNKPAKVDLSSTDGTMSPKPVIDAKKLPDDVLKMILEAKSEISEK